MVVVVFGGGAVAAADAIGAGELDGCERAEIDDGDVCGVGRARDVEEPLSSLSLSLLSERSNTGRDEEELDLWAWEWGRWRTRVSRSLAWWLLGVKMA